MSTRFSPGRSGDRVQSQINERLASTLDSAPPAFRLETGPTLNVAAGELRRIAPRSGGMEVVIPEASAATFGKTITLLIEASAGRARIQPVNGTIKGAASLVVPSGVRAEVRLVSGGQGVWLDPTFRLGEDVQIGADGDITLAAGGDITLTGGTITLDGTTLVGIPGRLLARTVYTSGTAATHNHAAGATLCRIYGVGGGGAGGGTEGTATAGEGGSCGASGTYGERTFTITAATSTYTVGAAGAGASGAVGGNGGSSTWTHDGTTTTLPGGGGGLLLAGGATITRQNGGTAAAAATNADYSVRGTTGGDVARFAAASTPMIHMGGGHTPFGPGGRGKVCTAAAVVGEAATGPGGGGAGRMNGTTTSTAGAGGNGGGGIWVVEEYE